MALVPQTLMPIVSGYLPASRAMPLDHLARQLLADLPGGLRRQRPRIDRVEIAAGRQHVGHAARRRAAGPGRNVTAVEPGQQIADLVAGLLERRHQPPADEIERLDATFS